MFFSQTSFFFFFFTPSCKSLTMTWLACFFFVFFYLNPLWMLGLLLFSLAFTISWHVFWCGGGLMKRDLLACQMDSAGNGSLALIKAPRLAGFAHHNLRMDYTAVMWVTIFSKRWRRRRCSARRNDAGGEDDSGGVATRRATEVRSACRNFAVAH